MQKKKFSEFGKVGAAIRWTLNVPPERLKRIQKLYSLRTTENWKVMVDFMTEGWGIDRLEKLIEAIEMKNPKRYKVLQDVVIQGTTYSAGVEVRLEASVGDPLVESGYLAVI